jgi:hypothetical protein
MILYFESVFIKFSIGQIVPGLTRSGIIIIGMATYLMKGISVHSGEEQFSNN